MRSPPSSRSRSGSCLPPLAWRRRSRRAWCRIGGTGRAAAGPGARPRGDRPGSRCRAGRRRGWGSGSWGAPGTVAGVALLPVPRRTPGHPVVLHAGLAERLGVGGVVGGVGGLVVGGVVVGRGEVGGGDGHAPTPRSSPSC